MRVPGGVITTDQLEAVAELSRESGWELGVHLTTRQGLELAGIPERRCAIISPVLKSRG